MSDRFRLALERIEPSQWQLFERLASKFLGDEFGELRTLASVGDEGQDAILRSPSGQEHIALQYSVALDWKRKVKATAKRIKASHPEVQVLVYATPQLVGATMDSPRKVLSEKYQTYLDVRDANWFIERQARSPVTIQAAEEFTAAIADPYLANAGVIDKAGIPFSDHESRAALLYLLLQRQDDDLDRQLTKLCFDALVRAALRDTSPNNRVPRAELHERVASLLPSHGKDDIHSYVDRALERLEKRAVRHYQKDDVFCLSYEERTRIAERVAGLEYLDKEFEAQIGEHLRFVAEGIGVELEFADMESLALRCRRILETFLSERGEAFVESLSADDPMLFSQQELVDIATHDLAQNPDMTSLRHNLVPLTTNTIERVLLFPTTRVQEYLRAVADSYTLFAFLRETPNVQAAVAKLFSHGDIWLDTSAVLPLLAEKLLEPEERRYTRLMGTAERPELGSSSHVA